METEKAQKLKEQQIQIEKERQLKEITEKEKRQSEILQKITEREQQRKQFADQGIKNFKEVTKQKPLYIQLDEKFQKEVVESDLAEKKRLLEVKRSLMNVVPGGALGSVVEEQTRLYRERKETIMAEIERKRRQDKLIMR